MAPSTLETPRTVRLGTWNALRDRPDRRVRGDVHALLRDHPLHALALNEAGDYHDVLGQVDGYRLFGSTKQRGDSENAWLVREDVKAGGFALMDLGGDGWTTVTGHHHVGLKVAGVTIADWLRAFAIHLPPSVDWPKPDRRPVGPPERVDDFVRAMQRLRGRATQAGHGELDGRLEDVFQRARYGSDHPLVTFKVARVGQRRGLCYTGDWNNKPGRDDGAFSAQWLANQAGMQIGRAQHLGGHLSGIDFPLIKRRHR